MTQPLARLTAVIILGLSCLPFAAGAAAINIACPGQTLQSGIDIGTPGDIINVTGTCSENVLIRNEKQRITIDGGGSAAVVAPNSALPAFNVRGKGILIQGLTISGGNTAVHVNRGSNAFINNNQIPSTGTHGVIVDQFSFAVITNNVIGPPSPPGSPTIPGFGILISDSSSARIGFNGETDPAAPNTIQFNGAGGIAVALSSTARIAHNLIFANQGNGVSVVFGSSALVGARSFFDGAASANTIQNNTENGAGIESAASATIVGNIIKGNIGHGVEVLTNAGATVASNEINSNGGAGVQVGDQATVRLGEQSGTSIFRTPNTTTLGGGQVLNSDAGIRCQRSGLAVGRIGTLNGSAGAKVFGPSLTLSVDIGNGGDLVWGPVDELDDAVVNSSNATHFSAAVNGATNPNSETVNVNKDGCRDQLS